MVVIEIDMMTVMVDVEAVDAMTSKLKRFMVANKNEKNDIKASSRINHYHLGQCQSHSHDFTLIVVNDEFNLSSSIFFLSKKTHYRQNSSRNNSRYGPPLRTEYRLIVENLSSRVSWQVCKPNYIFFLSLKMLIPHYIL